MGRRERRGWIPKVFREQYWWDQKADWMQEVGERVRDEPQDSSKDDGVQGGWPRVVGGTGNGTHPGQGLRTVCVSGCPRGCLSLWGSSAGFPAPVGRLWAQKLQAKVSSEVELLVSESPSIIRRLTHLLGPCFLIYKVRRLRNNRSKSLWFVKLWIVPDWQVPIHCYLLSFAGSPSSRSSPLNASMCSVSINPLLCSQSLQLLLLFSR